MRTRSASGGGSWEKGAEAGRERGRRGSASLSAQRGEDARTSAASKAARARLPARTDSRSFPAVHKGAAYTHATSWRDESAQAPHEIPQRLLRILRLHHAGREEHADRSEFQRFRDVFARLHARAAEHVHVRIRGSDAIDGLRDDLRLCGRHADVPSNQLGRLDRDVLRRQRRERLRLGEVVRARDDLEADLLAPRDARRHLLPRDLPFAVVDQRPGSARLEERLGRYPSGRLARFDGVHVLAEDGDVHELRDMGEVGRGRGKHDGRTCIIRDRRKALRELPAPLPEDFGIRLEVEDDDRDSHCAADGPSVGNRLGTRSPTARGTAMNANVPMLSARSNPAGNGIASTARFGSESGVNASFVRELKSVTVVRAAYHPWRSSSLSRWGSTAPSFIEPNASSIPGRSISRTTSSPALSRSSFTILRGTIKPRAEPHRRTLTLVRGTTPGDCNYHTAFSLGCVTRSAGRLDLLRLPPQRSIPHHPFASCRGGTSANFGRQAPRPPADFGRHGAVHDDRDGPAGEPPEDAPSGESEGRDVCGDGGGEARCHGGPRPPRERLPP